MDGSITIPKEMHAEMIEDFRLRYEQEFGPMDQNRAYSRTELIQKYARDLEFWRKHQPEIDVERQPTLHTLCRHAITTNAISNMMQLCEERGILRDVDALCSLAL